MVSNGAMNVMTLDALAPSYFIIGQMGVIAPALLPSVEVTHVYFRASG